MASCPPPVLPQPEEWHALLEAARVRSRTRVAADGTGERESGPTAADDAEPPSEDTDSEEPSEPVPHAHLVATVSNERDADVELAEKFVDTAVVSEWIERAGSGVGRAYVAAERADPNAPETTTAMTRTYTDDSNSTDPQPTEVLAALDAAIEYYHAQLTDERRWAIEEKWGIAPETIDDLRIGFAPAEDDLAGYLAEQGVSPVAALAAGVVRSNAVTHVYECDPEDCWHRDVPEELDELARARADGEFDAEEIALAAVVDTAREAGALDLYSWWDARIVFPYYEGGTARYLIARKTSESDDVPGKYLKLANTKPWVDDSVVYEPIYGTDTVRDGEDLILTEGITDAICAHEAGFACISPVTKGFKRAHYDRLLDYAERAERAYLCFDSESSGVGLDGALRTAWMLADNGVEALVAELPREDDGKVDLAEYLKTHDAGDLRAVLDEAVAPESHPAFDSSVHGGESGYADGDRPDPPGRSGTEHSALFDLSIRDVVEGTHGLSPGYRGDNPIRHVGDSHSEYFVYEQYRGGDYRARDYKTEYTYTALTWLLCDADARSVSNPGGSLSDEEIFEAWKHAKTEGILDETDPIPWRARLHLVSKHDLAPADLLNLAHDNPSNLPASIHNRVLDLVEDEYGLNPGKERLETGYRAEKRAEFLAGPDSEANGDGNGTETGTGAPNTDGGTDEEERGAQIRRMLATLDELERLPAN